MSRVGHFAQKSHLAFVNYVEIRDSVKVVFTVLTNRAVFNIINRK